jgi:type II secretory ATPase GspE/PulE/Tfp pilus assembly ATPase PilB-like protein
MATETSAVTVLDALLKEAHLLHASDVHLDPGASTLSARLRIDGTLKEVRKVPMKLHSEVIARLKILAGLRIDEQQLPQDGRFRFEVSSEIHIDVRVAISPTYYGEHAVLRLLFSSHALSTLESLGFSEAHQLLLRKALARPHGMILVTGPTGSGKTSTLYALLHLLNSRELSIVTIEDPIEYALDGINQIPVRSHVPVRAYGGLSFSEALRSVLRQDPNVIAVGEIRDAEAASLAIHAALTGHLVLSTLHTTDAPTAIVRLMDMGIEPYLIASTISIIINQRLVRRLCEKCKFLSMLRDDQIAVIALIFGPEVVFEKVYESAGCKACGGTGATGRIGVFEIMQMNTELRDATIQKTTARDLFTLAVTHGMLPLLDDGIRKASEGIVHVDEVLALATE